MLGGAMIAAPVLTLASTLAYIVGDGMNADAVGGTLQVYAVVATALAIIGLTRLLEAPLPRVSTMLTVLGMLAVAGGVAFGIDSIVYANDPVAALSEQETAAAGLALFLPGITYPLTFIGIGLSLAKTGVTARWSGLTLALGGLLFPMSRIPSIEALAVVADVVMLVGLASIGWSVLTGRRRSLQAVGAPSSGWVAA
jgi:hypothetical protein